MSIQRIYTDELAANFGYYAIWMPGTPIKLGVIGTLDKNVFSPVSTLENFNISYGIIRDRSKNDFKYASAGAVTVSQKASGEAAEGSKLGKADAGVIIEFNKSNAIYFNALGTLNHYIADKLALGNAIMELYKKGQWKKEWVVITQLVEADSATILISKEKGAKLELKAKADLKPAEIQLVNADFDSENSFSSSLSFKIVAKSGISPLFKLMGIKEPWFQEATFNNRDINQEQSENLVFTDFEVQI